MTYHDCEWAHFEPCEGRWQDGVPLEVGKLLRKRYYLVEKARNASIIGVSLCAAARCLSAHCCMRSISFFPTFSHRHCSSCHQATCHLSVPCRLSTAEVALESLQEVVEGLKTTLMAHERLRDVQERGGFSGVCAGIVVGTLGVAGYLQAVEQVRRLAQAAGKKTYTLLIGKPSPAKLANFPEVEVFVLVADPQVS